MVEVAKGVLEKLIIFSIAIVVLPLGLLFATLHGYLDRAFSWASSGLLIMSPSVHVEQSMFKRHHIVVYAAVSE